jgi:NADH-quinone oxidoreductase subunit J
MLTGEIVLYSILGIAALATALGMLLSRNAVYSVLALVLNFATIAVIYLMLGAPFIALVQITVYAGSIMVLFLFVIMLLGAEKLPIKESIKSHRPLAILLGVVMLLEIGVFIFWKVGLVPTVTTPSVDFATPTKIGMELFTRYALPVLITSVILLAATMGAILLTRADKIEGKKS